MKWEMEAEEVEAVLEKIWDLHDKISDAIHGISRAHFLKSIKTVVNAAAGKVDVDVGRVGCVFVKELGVYVEDAAIAEARSLNAIRTALENLEDHLEFFHTVQSHQRAERDAAIARLEQSRNILTMRLVDHQGKNHKVIKETLAFVEDVRNIGHFGGASEEPSEKGRSPPSGNMEVTEEKRPNILAQMLSFGITLAKKSIRINGIGEILGNATLFAVSMLAIWQLHQVVVKREILDSHMQEEASRGKGCKSASSSPDDYYYHMESLDVMLARG